MGILLKPSPGNILGVIVSHGQNLGMTGAVSKRRRGLKDRGELDPCARTLTVFCPSRRRAGLFELCHEPSSLCSFRHSSCSVEGFASSRLARGCMEAYSVRERPLPDSSSEDNPIYSPPPPRFNHPRPLTTANVDNDDGESSSTSSSHGDGDGLSSSALGLSLAPTYHPRSHRNASHRHPTATILTPISRPPSAVTVPFQPSRPASTVPNGDVRVGAGSGDGRSQPTVPPLFRPSHPIPPPSPQVRPRLVKRSAGPSAAPPFPRAGLERESSGGGRGGSTAVVDHEGAREWEGTREPEPERRERERGPPRRERQRIRSDHKGKGRERDVSVQQQAFDDPLDPFSSLHYLPPPADAAAPAKKPPPGRLASLSSDESLASSSKGILLNGHANGSAIPHQQSLQEILQSVDLSAALRLVQTVQQSQKAAAAAAATLPTPIPTIPTSLPIPPPPPAQSPQRTLPLRTTTRSATAALSSTSGYSLSSIDPRTPLLAEPTSPTSPITPTHVSIEEPSRARPMSMGGPPPTANGLAGVENRERRRTLSLSFAGGNFAVKRNRGPSMSSQLSSIAQERVPDERASLSEVARAFEGPSRIALSFFVLFSLDLTVFLSLAAEISRVHLTLSPATMRRAQNCAKYLSLRYTPVFNALVAGKSPPNLIAVAKYREMREDEERKSRRAKVGTSGRGGGTTDGEGDFRMVSAAHSDAGSSINGRLSTALAGISHSAYGPRRNKHPKAWEIYPDDFADYLAPPTALQQSFPPHAFNGTMYASIAPPPKSDVQAVSRASTTGGHSSFEFPAGRSTASSEASPISSPTRVDRQSYFPRPSAKSRENSFEGSPLARASRTSLDALLASPTGGAGVRRAGSLGSASVASPKSAGFSSLGTITSHVDFGGALQPIPSRPRNGSKNASLEHLSEPSSPRLGPFYSPPAHHHVTLHKHSQSDGLRQGVSRVVNKIRGKASTDVEASDVVGAGRKRTGLESAPDGGLLSRDVSDVDVAIPPRVHRPASSSGLSDQGGIGRSRIPGRKHVEGHHDGGYKSSGEEGGGRRRFFFGPFGVGPQKKGRMVVDSEGGEGKALAACGNGATPKITHRIFEDSDDEDQPIPREVKDLGDEDFARLNT